MTPARSPRVALHESLSAPPAQALARTLRRMSDVTAPQLARLLDVGERPRQQGWSLRAALTRFGQPRAQLASDVTEVLRRVEGALKPHGESLAREGGEVWRALTGGGDAGDGGYADLVQLLRVAADLDTVADALATWAADTTRERPDTAVEAAVADLAGRLDALGVAREDRPRLGRRRGV